MGVIEQAPDKLELSAKLTTQQVLDIGRQVQKERDEKNEKANV